MSVLNSHATELSLMNSVRALAFLLIVSMVAGCFRPSFQPGGVPFAATAARGACEDLNAKRIPIKSIRVLADATVSSESERASFRYVVLSKDPDSFRVDVLPVNGAFTLGILVAHGDKALWLDAQEKTYAEDNDERRLMTEYLGLRGVSRETAVAMVTGVLPTLPCSHVRLFQLHGGDRLFVDDESHVAWRVRGDSTELAALQVLDQSGHGVEVEGTYARTQPGSLGGVTLAIFAPARAKVEMTLTRVVKNPELNDQLFEVRPPRDYRRVQ